MALQRKLTSERGGAGRQAGCVCVVFSQLRKMKARTRIQGFWLIFWRCVHAATTLFIFLINILKHCVQFLSPLSWRNDPLFIEIVKIQDSNLSSQIETLISRPSLTSDFLSRNTICLHFIFYEGFWIKQNQTNQNKHHRNVPNPTSSFKTIKFIATGIFDIRVQPTAQHANV